MFMAFSSFASIKGTAASLTAYWRSIHFFLFNGNIGLMKKRFMFSTLKSGASRIHVKPCHSPRDCFHERESRRIRLHVQMRFWERFQFVQSCITLFTGRLQNEPMFSGEVSFRSKLDVENRFKKKNVKSQPNGDELSPEKQQQWIPMDSTVHPLTLTTRVPCFTART